MSPFYRSPSEWAKSVAENIDQVGEEFTETVSSRLMGDSRVIRVTEDEIVYLRYAQYPIPDRVVFLKYDPQNSEVTVYETNAEGLVTI